MKGGATTALLVALLVIAAASLHTADAAAVAARRLGAADAPLSEVLTGPPRNNCSNNPNNQGKGCHGPPLGQQAAAQSPAGVVLAADPKPNPCTHDPSDPTQTKCRLSPPLPTSTP
ncbi:hypothetical protein BS78_02G176500 [Paspalum vaginatum]|nr:hypothetical protein BS78_02G176300 [Paspalum vaginatum]KAJ1289594.1 hypothetical protein BS78_02G176500 [Paspalum vaginatum]